MTYRGNKPGDRKGGTLDRWNRVAGGRYNPAKNPEIQLERQAQRQKDADK